MSSSHETIWTNEAIDFLRNDVAEGKSASIIGRELTEKFEKEFTRNAVVGKIFRLKMGKKSPPIIFKARECAMNPRPKHKLQSVVNGSRYEARHNIVELFLPPEIDIEKTPPLMVCIDELDFAGTSENGRCNMCRYLDRDDNGVAIYCGLPTGGKSSWCSYHRQITTRPSLARYR